MKGCGNFRGKEVGLVGATKEWGLYMKSLSLSYLSVNSFSSVSHILPHTYLNMIWNDSFATSSESKQTELDLPLSSMPVTGKFLHIVLKIAAAKRNTTLAVEMRSSLSQIFTDVAHSEFQVCWITAERDLCIPDTIMKPFGGLPLPHLFNQSFM